MVDIVCRGGRIPNPVPLKHHTETAYMIILALVAALSGFIASILPHVPHGLPAWSICMTLSVLYPLFLSRSLKENRADYEFRALHWFPALIFILWIFFEFFGSKARILHILQLGFFFLWSLPLVALTIAFLILFSLHVIRRWIPRVVLLSFILALFTAGAVMAESWNINPALQRSLFAEHTSLFSRAKLFASKAAHTLFDWSLSPDVQVNSVGPSSSLSSSTSSIEIDGLQMKSSLPPAIAQRKPRGLSASGPEDVAVLFLTIMALYSMTLHVRARRRI